MGVDPGSRVVVSAPGKGTWSAVPGTNHTVRAEVDVNAEVAETNETNQTMIALNVDRPTPGRSGTPTRRRCGDKPSGESGLDTSPPGLVALW